MNLNQESFPEEISNAISLKQITSSNYEPVSIARNMVFTIQSRITQLKKEPANILREFNLSLYKKNESVILRKGNELIATNIIGVSEAGHLLTDMGSFTIGEVDLKLNV